MFPTNGNVLQQPVTVDYESRGKRVRKELPTAYAARQFYCRMHKAGSQRWCIGRVANAAA